MFTEGNEGNEGGGEYSSEVGIFYRREQREQRGEAFPPEALGMFGT